MKIFITGDTHSDFSRLMAGESAALDRLSKEDYVIICGDFGGLWDGSIEEQRQLLLLNQRPFTTLFISGNHENYDLLARFPVSKWKGGKVRFVRSSIIHLLRGQVYTLGGRKFFTMGGASSHDISDGILDPDDPLFERKFRQLYLRGAHFRVNRQTWWPEELPSKAEYQEAKRSLARHHWAVDYIVTHCAPTSIQAQLPQITHDADALTDFLDSIRQKCQFKKWFFGHYHEDLQVAEKFVLLYERVMEL